MAALVSPQLPALAPDVLTWETLPQSDLAALLDPDYEPAALTTARVALAQLEHATSAVPELADVFTQLRCSGTNLVSVRPLPAALGCWSVSPRATSRSVITLLLDAGRVIVDSRPPVRDPLTSGPAYPARLIPRLRRRSRACTPELLLEASPELIATFAIAALRVSARRQLEEALAFLGPGAFPRSSIPTSPFALQGHATARRACSFALHGSALVLPTSAARQLGWELAYADLSLPVGVEDDTLLPYGLACLVAAAGC